MLLRMEEMQFLEGRKQDVETNLMTDDDGQPVGRS